MSKILYLLSGQVSHLNLCHPSTWGDRNRSAIAVLQGNITSSSEEGRGGRRGTAGEPGLGGQDGVLRALGLRCHLPALGDIYLPAPCPEGGI